MAPSLSGDDCPTAVVDYREVGRKAYEMELAYGREGARRYAAKLSNQATSGEKSDEGTFWKAVELSLTTR